MSRRAYRPKHYGQVPHVAERHTCMRCGRRGTWANMSPQGPGQWACQNFSQCWSRQQRHQVG